MTLEAAGLRALLALLAGYHLAIGLLSAFAPARAFALSGRLYALRIEPTPQLRYATRMLGLYALTLSYLLGLALYDPPRHPDAIRACALLLGLRAIWRVVFRAELQAAFGVSSGRNLFHAALLIAEAGLLWWWCPS